MEQAAAENDVEARIAKIQADHDARVASLIEANNQLVQNVRDERARRIEAEKWSEQLKSHLMAKYEELGDLEADAVKADVLIAKACAIVAALIDYDALPEREVFDQILAMAEDFSDAMSEIQDETT